MTRNQEIGTFKVPVGATRPAVISGLNITYIWLIPVLALPLLFIWVTRNIFWAVLALPMLHIARKSNSDPGLPRIWFLSLIGGSMLTDRSERAAEIVSAVRPADETDGVLRG